MKDQDIAQAWRAGNQPGPSAAGSGPTLDEIDDLLADRLDPARRQQLIDAIAEHGEYAWLLQMASDVQMAATASVEAVDPVVRIATAANDDGLSIAIAVPVRPVPSAGRRNGPPQWIYALAASLVLGLGTLMLLRPPAAEQPLRSVAAEQIEPLDSSRLAQAPTQLRWTESADARTRYVVTLYNARAESLWRSEPTAATAVSLPPSLQQQLVPGAYYWQLDIEGGEGGSRGPFRFEIEP